MTQKQEAEANAFAMELLMPKKMFIEEANKIHEIIRKKNQMYYRVGNSLLNSDAYLINRLSNKFQVSEEAVKTRMFNLGILTSI